MSAEIPALLAGLDAVEHALASAPPGHVLAKVRCMTEGCEADLGEKYVVGEVGDETTGLCNACLGDELEDDECVSR